MKYLFLSLLFASSAILAQTTPVKETFEVEPAGCLNSAHAGSCVIQNRSSDPIYCKIGISAKTSHGINLGNNRDVMIPPNHFETVQIFAAQGDTITSVAPSARCTK